MIFNMVGGGGGSGATLVVSSPVNVSVTVSKDDKSYTKNSGSLGSTTFKGLATGTWTVTIRGNGQNATRTIEITADYTITIAFFSATINITYPANSDCVVTNSGGQTVASDTNSTSSEKTFTATVNATGTYTVTATATDGSGKSKSQSVSITADGQSVNVALSYTLYLYTNGVENVAWTTKNGAGNVARVSKESTFLKFFTRENVTFDEACAYTPVIDLSSYNEVHVIGTYDSASGITIEVRNSSDSVVATTSVSKTSNDLTAVLDVSGITETDVSVRINVAAAYPGGAVTLATISEVYAE